MPMILRQTLALGTIPLLTAYERTKPRNYMLCRRKRHERVDFVATAEEDIGG
jgi:hypothetical protein